MSLEQSIGDLIAATNALREQVSASMQDIETRIIAKLDAADIQQIIHDLLMSGEIPINVPDAQLSVIISQKIASGELGTQATTLGGKPASAYALKVDSLQKDTILDAN